MVQDSKLRFKVGAEINVQWRESREREGGARQSLETFTPLRAENGPCAGLWRQ
jgi:hypothetical protein